MTIAACIPRRCRSLRARPRVALSLALAVTALALATGTADAQTERARDGATEIVLLGTSHFAGSASDEQTSEVADLLSDRRQRELEQVAEQLADWGPDRFFVECMPDRQSQLDSLYRAYRDGDYHPTEAGDRGEIRQLGLRVARAAGLDGLECMDAAGLWLGARAREVAGEHNPEVLSSYREHVEDAFDRDSLLGELSLGEYLVELNREDQLWANHKIYMYYYARMGSFEESGMETRRESDLAGSTFAVEADLDSLSLEKLRDAVHSVDGELVDGPPGPDTDYVVVLDRNLEDGGHGADTLNVRELGDLIQRTSTTWVGFPDHHIGADLVGEWYKRNLRIYANIWRAVADGDDRVVVLIGQGHVWTLRQFFRENPDFEVVPVEAVL